MMFMRLLSLIVLLLMSVGCSTDEQTLQLIEQAESVMIEHPDSALNIIRSVDAESIRGEEDMAHYRLAMAEAMYHNYMDEGLDSLTTLFYDYYLASDDHAKRARALYQHAYVMHQKGNIADAVFALREAEKSVNDTKNYRLAGLVHQVKGDLYNSQFLFSDALASYELAYQYFNRIDLSSHGAYAVYSIGAMYSKLKNYQDAIYHLQRAEKLAIDLNDLYLLYTARMELCLVYLQQGLYENVESILQSVSTSEFQKFVNCKFYCAKAIVSAFNKDYQLAEEYIKVAGESIITSEMYVDYSRYVVLILKEDYYNAHLLYKNMIKNQNTNVYHLITDSPLHYYLQLLESDIHHEKEINKKNEIINNLIYILIATVFISFILYVYSNNKRKRQHIVSLIAQVESVQNELFYKSEKIKSLSAMAEEKRCAVVKMQHQLNVNICRGLQNINSLLDAYYTDNTKSLKQREIIATIDRYVENFAENPDGYLAVEQFVNLYRDNIMELLRIELPMLKESDYRLLCLVYADFSSNAICMFMSYDKNKLYKQKSKLKSIIMQSGCEHMSIFLKYL